MLTMKLIDPKAKSNLLYVSPEVFDQMQQIPTVDAEPVVRCKDCINCLIDNSERKYHLCTSRIFVFRRKVDLEDFCSYGEPKAEAR